MDLEEVKKYIDLFEKSKLCKFSIKKKDTELFLEKNGKSKKIAKDLEDVKDIEEGAKQKEDNVCFVTSPMVGTFYKSPAPDKKPFVSVGDVVSEDTIVCIVEAMKVLNEVKAGVAGIVKEICCKNAKSA